MYARESALCPAIGNAVCIAADGFRIDKLIADLIQVDIVRLRRKMYAVAAVETATPLGPSGW